MYYSNSAFNYLITKLWIGHLKESKETTDNKVNNSKVVIILETRRESCPGSINRMLRTFIISNMLMYTDTMATVL